MQNYSKIISYKNQDTYTASVYVSFYFTIMSSCDKVSVGFAYGWYSQETIPEGKKHEFHISGLNISTLLAYFENEHLRKGWWYEDWIYRRRQDGLYSGKISER
jgi:hypothetical protein